MIIDSHLHTGNMLEFDLEIEKGIAAMDKYGISFALFSNTEATEVDHEQNELPLGIRKSQIYVNQKALSDMHRYPGRLGMLLWCMPYFESCDSELENFVEENIKDIYGLKFHPFHSKTSFDSKKIIPYIELARKYKLPILVHTAADSCSDVKHVYNMALKYPDVCFICAHLGLGTDNEEAIDLVSKLPNLYADTAWVSKEGVKRAIAKCGKDKIMFGSDAPINGIEHYEFYKPYLQNELGLTSVEYEHLMYKNAMRIFKIGEKND